MNSLCQADLGTFFHIPWASSVSFDLKCHAVLRIRARIVSDVSASVPRESRPPSKGVDDWQQMEHCTETHPSLHGVPVEDDPVPSRVPHLTGSLYPLHSERHSVTVPSCFPLHNPALPSRDAWHASSPISWYHARRHLIMLNVATPRGESSPDNKRVVRSMILRTSSSPAVWAWINQTTLAWINAHLGKVPEIQEEVECERPVS